MVQTLPVASAARTGSKMIPPRAATKLQCQAILPRQRVAEACMLHRQRSGALMLQPQRHLRLPSRRQMATKHRHLQPRVQMHHHCLAALGRQGQKRQHRLPGPEKLLSAAG